MPEANVLYEFRGLCKSYDRQEVLKNLNGSILRGSFVALLGANGVGKSTLMRLLAQSETFDEGELLFDGKSLSSSSVALNPCLAFVHEEVDLPGSATLKEWTFQYSRTQLESRGAYRLERVLGLFEVFKMDGLQPFRQLSRGQKMKALFALEAGKEPAVYVLDEITSVLDSYSRLEALRFLSKEIQRGATVIVSTNMAIELQGFATHLILLDNQSTVLNCEVAALDGQLAKVRLPTSLSLGERGELEEKLVLEGGTCSSYNSDGSWSWLVKRSAFDTHFSARAEELLDKRQITMEDLAVHFSNNQRMAE